MDTSGAVRGRTAGRPPRWRGARDGTSRDGGAEAAIGRDGEVDGVVLARAEDGRRSSTAVGRHVFAAAADVVDPALAATIRSEPDWRHRYLDHVRGLTLAELRAPIDAVQQVPRAGVAALHEVVHLARHGVEVPLAALAEVPVDGPPGRVEVTGGGAPPRALAVPDRGTVLSGRALRERLAGWVDGGIAEPSFAARVGAVIDDPTVLDLRDRTIVVFGAGSELGPLEPLVTWGATVVPLDLPGPQRWERILATIRAGSGRAIVPVRATHGPGAPDAGGRVDPTRGADAALAARAGVDLTSDLPELVRWLRDHVATVVVVNSVYADGVANVLVSAAVDAVTASLHADGRVEGVAALATPTDVYAVGTDVVAAARERFRRSGHRRLVRATRLASRGRLLTPNHVDTVRSTSGREFGVADALVPQQGPNYALAKRVHRWRARLAETDGLAVSANVAPPTRTRSVTRSRLLAAAYAGAGRFDAEVFEPDTARWLMAALLAYDLAHTPAQGTDRQRHPLELFAEGANHGGLWRVGYAPRSVLPLAAAVGLPATLGRR